MGLLDSLKSVVQAVTGGAARVTIEFPQAAPAGGDLPVRVTATSSGGEVKSQGVFVDLLATERIAIPAATLAQNNQPGATQTTAQQPGWQQPNKVGGQPAWPQSPPQAEVTAATFPTGGNFGPPQQAVTGQPPAQQRDVNVSHVTFNQAFQIAPALVLAAGETRVFDGSIRLPVGVQPTYAGKHAHHEWHIRGRLEAWGNDPDSGYQAIQINVNQ